MRRPIPLEGVDPRGEGFSVLMLFLKLVGKNRGRAKVVYSNVVAFGKYCAQFVE